MRDFNNGMSLKKQINLFLDNELPSEDQMNLMHKVESDPRCNKIFNREKDFREFVRNNVKRPSVSPGFIQNLKDRIQS
ncbi:MAG: hypothetical protein H7X99_05295 [Saprospiraceae bacterium]|nr:hypothetical protein [Saprospiraceae bacterium]